MLYDSNTEGKSLKQIFDPFSSDSLIQVKGKSLLQQNENHDASFGESPIANKQLQKS